MSTPDPVTPVTPDPVTPDPLVRPEWVPEKFWREGAVDAENLAKSYSALETKFHAARPPALEVPETPEGYQLKPEKIPEGISWNEEMAKQFAGVFHAKGVPAEAAMAITQTFLEVEKANHAAISEAYEKSIQDGTAALKKEWGQAFDTKMGRVKSVVATLGYDPADASLFSNPKVVSFLGKVVGMLSEDSVASMRGAVAPGHTFVNGAEEAHAIMTDSKHPDFEKYHAGDRVAIAKVKRLIDG
jgi:hypothetical protein